MRYSPFRHIGSAFWKRKPVQLTFFLTKRCNAKCSFCFYLSKREGDEKTPELSLNEIEKISASMGKLLWLAFSGGEIFLRDDLPEITKVFYEKNKPALILLPTNGLLPDVIRDKTEEILRQCPKSTIVVKLSIDGPEELHDSIRGVKGAFRKTIETYEALSGLLDKYKNFELGVNSVFMSLNQDKMEWLIEFVKGMKMIKTHTVSLIRGDVSDEGLKAVDTSKYLKTITNMEADLKGNSASIYRFRGARLKAAQDILQRRLIHDTLIKKRRLIPCYAGRLNLVLTEAGDVYPCESFTMGMGNVRDFGCDVAGLLNSEKAKGVPENIEKGGCYCTHECYLMTNILFNPRGYGGLLKEYFRLCRKGEITNRHQ
jgi:MoaA/NifB/PqqE/SkfB family radical SAM enzyme